MHAVTICQPWAWAITHHTKRVENRRWATPHRGPLLIHAGKSREYLCGKLNDGTAAPQETAMPFGAIVGVADLVACWELEKWFTRRMRDNDIDPKVYGAMQSVWAEGPVCWVLANVRALAEPVPCRGDRLLWDAPADVMAKVQEQLKG